MDSFVICPYYHTEPMTWVLSQKLMVKIPQAILGYFVIVNVWICMKKGEFKSEFYK